MEKTFIMLKPDAIQRGLIGEIIARFEKKGCKLVAAKFMQVPRQLAEQHYQEHKGKSFFEPTVAYITSSPVLAMVWQGKDIVKLTRTLMGKTNPADADPGSIRGSLATDVSRNLVHGSDSPKSAEREIALYFSPDEIAGYVLSSESWLCES